MNKILMTSSAKSFEPIIEGMIIPIPPNHVEDFEDSEYGRFYYVQHNHMLNEPTHGKIAVRGSEWRGALKAFVLNKIDNPTGLKVLRLSKSGKSLICEAVQ